MCAITPPPSHLNMNFDNPLQGPSTTDELLDYSPRGGACKNLSRLFSLVFITLSIWYSVAIGVSESCGNHTYSWNLR